MNGGDTQAGRGLQEAQESLSSLQASLRTARVVRIVGSLAALVIAVIYALMFIGLGRAVLDTERLTGAVKRELEDKSFQDLIDRVTQRAQSEVVPELRKAVAQRIEELGLGDALAEQGALLAKDVFPELIARMKDKAGELDLTKEFASEFGKLAADVGPVYSEHFRKMAEDLDLLSAFTGGMKEQAGKIGTAYRAELRKIAPDIQAELDAEKANLARDLGEWLQDRVNMEVKGAIDINKFSQAAGFTEAEFEEILADAVISAQDAIKGMVTRRTDTFQGDLQEINELLDTIPLSKQTDTAWLENEMGQVLIQLLKVKLPDHKSELEW